MSVTVATVVTHWDILGYFTCPPVASTERQKYLVGLNAESVRTTASPIHVLNIS